MISILRASELWMKPILASTMYSERRRQFSERLGWPVDVDSLGYERDEYDLENPLYIIVEDKNGHHAGSMRLLPTTGRTMISEHFRETIRGYKFNNPLVWECTRFCVSQHQNRTVSAILLVVAARIMHEAQLEKLIAIFDRRMIALYQRSGVSPEVIGAHNYEHGTAYAGLWSFDSDKYAALLSKSGLDAAYLELVIANATLPWLTDTAPVD